MRVAPLADSAAGVAPGAGATDALQEVLQNVRLELGEVPELFLCLGQAPDSLRSLWSLLEATLLQGRIPRTTKELIALAAASAAEVEPLKRLLRRTLAERGVDQRVLDDLVSLGETHRIPERTQRILFLGRRAALQPALLTSADFARLRRDGLDDPELAELVAFSGALALLIATSRALGCV